MLVVPAMSYVHGTPGRVNVYIRLRTISCQSLVSQTKRRSQSAPSSAMFPSKVNIRWPKCDRPHVKWCADNNTVQQKPAYLGNESHGGSSFK